MSNILYFTTENHGIWEIVRVDTTLTRCEVVQTNIRTVQKAIRACMEWQEREDERGKTSV
jgi:hypothetical protein